MTQSVHEFLDANPGPVVLEFEDAKVILTGSAALSGASAGVFVADASRLRDVAGAFRSSNRRLWVGDALAFRRAHGPLLDEAGVGTESLWCGKTALRALAPTTVSASALDGRFLVGVLVDAVRTASPSGKARALEVCAEEMVLRRRAVAGWRLDVRLAQRLAREQADEKSAIGRVLDLRIDAPDRAHAEWLRSIGVVPAFNTSGFLKFEECRLNPDANLVAWEQFRQALRARQAERMLRSLIRMQVGGRVFPDVEANNARTGRAAWSRPGLGSLKKSLRGVLIPDPGMVFVTVDHSSAEVRCVAALSGCPDLLRAVSQGDPYQLIAEACGLDRTFVKRVWNPLAYGQGEASAVREFGPRALAVRAAIAEEFPGMMVWLADAGRRARSGERFESLFGRNLGQVDESWKAANLLVQSSGRDALGVGIRNAAAAGLDLMLTLHDSITVQCRPADALEVERALEDAMRIAMPGGFGVVLSGIAETSRAWR